MKKTIFFLLIPFLAVAGFVATQHTPVARFFASGDSTLVLQPQKQHYEQAALIASILSKYHYSHEPLTDSISADVYDEYLAAYDNFRMYLLASDVAEFEPHRFRLDDELKEGDVNFAFRVFTVFKQRADARLAKVPAMLEQINDFATEEEFAPDRSKAPWANTEAELDDIWRKTLKNQLLTLKLTGKDLPAARELVAKRYARFGKAVDQYHSEDVFELYMNAFTGAFDPHTSYFAPITAENFEIDMSLSLEGIGARLLSDNDYVTFSEIIPGGPAFKSKQLFPRDRIVGVAQEADTAFTDIVGWRTDDAVQLIRGPKGSVVRLQVLPADADVASVPLVVTLVRDKIKLEEQAATQKIIEQKKGNRTYKIGVITVPSFYRDFEAASAGDNDFRSTSRDVKKLIADLQAAGVEGIVMDLRNNGGGSLTEAVELTGLFIKEGPVVQVKNANGKLDIGEDTDPEVVYEGPLAVLTNRFSASASEIFAGAIQDYKRGIVVGEATYGKGTVQNIIDLGQLMSEEENKMGQLKLTLAKYYRVNGGSTQHQGVKPDFELPSPYSAEEYGESAQPNALPWDQIRTAKFTASGQVTDRVLATLRARYLTRLRTEPSLKELQEEIKFLQEEDAVQTLSLNEDKRKAELEARKQKEQQFRNFRQAEADPELGQTRDGQAPSKDVYLDECLRILTDWFGAMG